MSLNTDESDLMLLPKTNKHVYESLQISERDGSLSESEDDSSNGNGTFDKKNIQQIKELIWDIVSFEQLPPKYNEDQSFKVNLKKIKNVKLIFEIWIFTLIVSNVIVVIIDSDRKINENPSWIKFFDFVILFSVINFSFEFTARLWSCTIKMDRLETSNSNESPSLSDPTDTPNRSLRKSTRQRLRWVLTPFPLIDLISLIPYWIDLLEISDSLRGTILLRFVRLVRLIQIFRLERHAKGLQRLVQVFYLRGTELLAVFFVGIVLMIASSSIMFYLENSSQPEEFESIWDSLWWASTTLTTVGYGDIVPHTTGGKLVASIVSLIGVILFALPAAIIGSELIRIISKERDVDDDGDDSQTKTSTPSTPTQTTTTTTTTSSLPNIQSPSDLTSSTSTSCLNCPHCRKPIHLKLNFLQ